MVSVPVELKGGNRSRAFDFGGPSSSYYAGQEVIRVNVATRGSSVRVVPSPRFRFFFHYKRPIYRAMFFRAFLLFYIVHFQLILALRPVVVWICRAFWSWHFRVVVGRRTTAWVCRFAILQFHFRRYLSVRSWFFGHRVICGPHAVGWVVRRDMLIGDVRVFFIGFCLAYSLAIYGCFVRRVVIIWWWIVRD